MREEDEARYVYSTVTLFWTVVLGFIKHLRSRNQMDKARNSRAYSQTVFECSGQGYSPDDPNLHTACSHRWHDRFARADSVRLENALLGLVRHLVRGKWFDSARLCGWLAITVDGTLRESVRSSALPEREMRRHTHAGGADRHALGMDHTESFSKGRDCGDEPDMKLYAWNFCAGGTRHASVKNYGIITRIRRRLPGKGHKKMNVSKMLVAPAILATAFTAYGYVRTATPFADNMVLQRGRTVPVWGFADPDEKVTVSFAGQTKTAQAGADGKWCVSLDAMDASKENRILKVTGATNAEEIKNVLVGEVWFASGQSNTECPIWGSEPRYRDGQGAVMTAMTRRPFIRYVKNQKIPTREPRFGWKAVWRDYSPKSFKETFNHNLSAMAFYYALELHDALGVPVGIIDSSWGGTCIEPWTPISGFANKPKIPAKGGRQTPTYLWNGMVAAFAPYAIKGFIWYQGCSNAGDGIRYCDKMHDLYNGWAKEFKNPDLKLYFVQLAPFSRSWFSVQMGQAKFAAEEKNAAMITTCDMGNSWDIHPNDKESVARRLVLHALKRDYGFTDIIDDAPVLKAWNVEGNKFVMSFDNANSWYAYNADCSNAQGFEIAGKDGKYVPAKILNKGANATLAGKELIVSAPSVKEPRRLRYLFSKPWIGSLYSFDSGLPLGPFEIDARRPEDDLTDANAKLGDALKVPELAGFRRILAVDIPEDRFAGYSFNEAAKAGAFTRVAYALELERADGAIEWAVVAMDVFTDDAAKLGVPCASRATFQRKVSNLIVRSNRIGVEEGAVGDGVIEFFLGNYETQKKLADVGGSDKVYDCNDAEVKGKDGYGCMQVHNAKSGATVFAYNHFAIGGAPDLGIGSNKGNDHTDWTFMYNAGDYKTRRLTVLVK